MKMTKIRSTLALTAFAAAALAVLAPACGKSADCVTLCNESQKCTGAQPQNCTQSCQQAETLASAAGCTSQYNDALNCAAGVSDVCTDKSCTTQSNAFAACIVTYCLAHASDANCKTGG